MQVVWGAFFADHDVTALYRVYNVCCTNKGWNLVSIHVVLGVCVDLLPIYTLPSFR